METDDKPTHVKFVLKTFTTAQLEAILQTPNFRKLKPARRDLYLSSMQAGTWDAGTGETISFDESDALVNGQHRLAAAHLWQQANPGRKVWFWCAMGVRTQSAECVDQGAPRRLLDYIRRQGIPYGQFVSSIVPA